MRNCMAVGNVVVGVICADAHLGYAQPLGGVIACEGQISISGVGSISASGNVAVRLGTLLLRSGTASAPLACDLQFFFAQRLHYFARTIDKAPRQGSNRLCFNVMIDTVGAGPSFLTQPQSRAPLELSYSMVLTTIRVARARVLTHPYLPFILARRPHGWH